MTRSSRGFMLMTDAVQEFGISRSTLYRLAKAGRIRIYARTGDRRSYVNRQEVAALSEFKPKPLKRT
ncbi:MAG TPA: helix-turn-helix domain-containing protein [Dehalococcoidia bacterium]